MTGWGAAAVTAGDAHVAVSLRSVNHRHFDVRTRFDPELLDLVEFSESLTRRTLERGRVEITGRIDRAEGNDVLLNLDRARAALRQLDGLQRDLARDEPVPLALLSVVPGLFVTGAPLDPDRLRAAFEEALRKALDDVSRMRAVEGDALRVDITTRIETIRQLTDAVAQRSPALVADYRNRLVARIGRLLSDGTLAADPGRLEAEVVIYADRSDIAEELTRLTTHCDHFLQVTRERDPVGRKLDFLLQEMAREANTIGSKIGDAATAHLVVDIKTELERVREQAQNVL